MREYHNREYHNIDLWKIQHDHTFKNLRAKIIGNRITVEGLFVGGFSFDLTSDYMTPFEQVKERAKNAITQLSSLGTFSEDMMEAVRKLTSRISLQNLAFTTELWIGVEKPQFSVTLLFIAITQKDDVRKPVRDLADFILPTEQQGKLVTPGGYTPILKPSPNQRIKGTVLVKIGNFFKAPNQIITGLTLSLSEEIMPNGLPIYSTITVGFRPYRMVEKTGFISYIS